MDVVIHTHHNVTLKLELSYFDSILDIKLQLQSLLGIHTSRQTLFHHNTLLSDNLTIYHSTTLLHNSILNLIIKPPSSSSISQINTTLLIQSPLSKRHQQVEFELKSRVLALKQRIGEKQNIPSSLLTAFLRGKELEDERVMEECDGIERDDVVIEIDLVGNGGYKIDHLTVKVVVFLSNVNLKIPMTLNLFHQFSDLRRQLERLKNENRINLPSDWFFVFGKERVMLEFLPFEKFKIQNGDVLQVWSTVKMQQNAPETPPPTTINVEDTSSTPSPKVQIMLKMPTPISPISLQMSPNETFSKLKDKIQDLEQIPKSRISLQFNNKEFHDQTSLHEFNRQEVEVGVSVKQSPTTSVGSGASHGSGKKVKLMVVYKNGTERIQVEMNAADNVGELRKELGKMQERMGFELPGEGYFFVYKQNIMDDDKSFKWHKVGHGDIIEVFSGTVTGGG